MLYHFFTVQLELWLLEIEKIFVWLQCFCSRFVALGLWVCWFVVGFFFVFRRSATPRPLISTATHVTLRLPPPPTADACDGLLCCFRHLWMEQQSHTDTDKSLIRRVKINTSAKVLTLLCFFFLSFLFSFCQSTQHFVHFPKEQAAERALSQRNVFYKVAR